MEGKNEKLTSIKNIRKLCGVLEVQAGYINLGNKQCTIIG